MTATEEIARVAHEANRAWQMVTEDPAPSPPWDEAPAWQRESAIEGVRQALAGTSAEELHDAWCSHKEDGGWQYGPVKDLGAKTHPCLAPYVDLPEGQRLKDALFAAICAALS